MKTLKLLMSNTKGQQNSLAVPIKRTFTILTANHCIISLANFPIDCQILKLANDVQCSIKQALFCVYLLHHIR